MSFDNEFKMYGIIADYLEQGINRFKGCKTVIDKISFNLLKGWRIDVAGILQKKSAHYIIAVEAKNKITPESILQAISQAEMYQRTCDEVYIALPKEEIYVYKKDDRSEWEWITNLCKLRAIGIIEVGMTWQDCSILIDASGITRYNDLYNDVLDQLILETIDSFDGLKIADFEYYTGKADHRKELLEKKIRFLVEEIKLSMLNNPGRFPSMDPGKLTVELPMRGFRRDLCWFFVAEVKRGQLPYFPHFTFHVDEDGLSCMLSLQSVSMTKRFIRKLKTELTSFLSLMEELANVHENYRLRVWQQVPESGKPRRSQLPWHEMFSYNLGYLDKTVVDLIIKKLILIRFPVVRFVCPPIWGSNPKLYTKDVVRICTNWIEELQNLYSFFSN